MADLGAVGSQYARYSASVLAGGESVQPIQATYSIYHGAAAGGGMQAIYRWTGTVWEQIKVSVWNGSSWVLV